MITTATPSQPVHNGTTPIFGGLVRDCFCEDSDLERLRDLMADGLDQMDASRLLWGQEPAWDAPRASWVAWARLRVAEQARALRAQLGLVAT